jgi:hypothetical protein
MEIALVSYANLEKTVKLLQIASNSALQFHHFNNLYPKQASKLNPVNFPLYLLKLVVSLL